MWNAAYNENDNVDLRTFVDDVFLRLNDYEMIEEKLVDIKGQIDCDEIKTWEEVEKKDDEANILRWCVNMAFRGAVSFITLKGVASANIPLLNRKIRELLKREEKGGYYSTFRLIDGLLPRPEHSSFDVIPVKIPAGNRPSCRYHFLYKEIEGEIGEIYLYEHGMHAYYVSVNVYDVDNPEELLDENHILDISDITLSELLTSLQQAIDPARENAELSAAIEKATNLETEKSALAQILTDCGIYALSMSDFGRTPHYCDGHISGGVDYMVVEGHDVVLVLNSSTLKIDNVVLNEQCGNYSWIVEEIKAAANTAYKRATL